MNYLKDPVVWTAFGIGSIVTFAALSGFLGSYAKSYADFALNRMQAMRM